jgi:predicted DNA-binding transcriptional regulator AlpA
MTDSLGRLLLADEVAERLRISVKRLYNLHAEGKGPPSVRLECGRRYPERQFEEYLRSQTTPVPPE